MKAKLDYKSICDVVKNPPPELLEAGKSLNGDPVVMYNAVMCKGVRYESKTSGVQY